MLGPKSEELLRVLDSTIALLEAQGEDFWASKLSRCRELIASEDFYGIEKLRDQFGGMGSFNDLIFSPLDGNASSDMDAERLNSRLDDLRTRMWSLSAEIHREVIES